MADTVPAETRSRIMSRVRAKNTGPEMAVRRYLHARGFRYRLNDRTLPGTPDLVLPRYHAAVFVHGCFWHRHPKCRFAYTPKSRQTFWTDKFAANVARDNRARRELEEQQWAVFIVWECEVAEGTLNRLAAEIVLRGAAGLRR